MKRKKWYKYKNSETGHVIHSPILPEDMTLSEGDTYYELVGHSRLSRKERKTLHVYRCVDYVAMSMVDGSMNLTVVREYVAMSMVDGMNLCLDLFDAGGEYVDSIPMKMTRR